MRDNHDHKLGTSRHFINTIAVLDENIMTNNKKCLVYITILLTICNIFGVIISCSTDPQVWLYLKGRDKKAKLCFMGHAFMENRNGLIVDGCVTQATGQAERVAALAMIQKRANRPTRITLGGAKVTTPRTS